MTDSMNFGPEWLRTLSQAPVQVPLPRYQLAEFRYGREEMLALFSTTLVPPDSLKQITGLFVKEAQLPLALSTMSDEETRMWNRGINSDAVLRSGKGSGGRGRGRGTGGPGGGGPGGGGGGIGYYGRGGSNGPPGSELSSRPTGPGGGLGGPIGPYEESDIGFARPNRPFDRSQSERGRDSWSERNGGEGRGGGGRNTSSENWRRGGRGPVSGIGSEEEEWRPAAKWSISSDRPYSNRGRANSGNWRDEDNWDPMPHSKSNNHHLPEWATEKNSEGGGTFDASGAFRSAEANIDDDRQSNLKRTRKISSSKSPHEPGPELRKSQDGDDTPTPSGVGDAPWSTGGGGSLDREEVEGPAPDAAPPEPSMPEMTSPPPSKDRGKSVSSVDPPAGSANRQKTSPSEPPVDPPPSVPAGNMQKSVHPKTTLQPQASQPAAKLVSPPSQHLLLPDGLSDDPLNHMTDDIAADLVAKLMEEEENKDKQWYYRDPQGQVQGPFSCAEMAEWFQSGYFTLSLLVRRACDPNYAPLGELIKLWGCIPFMPEPHPTEEVANVVASRQVQDNLVMAQYHQHYRNLMIRQQAAVRAQMPVPPPNKVPQEWVERQPTPIMDQVLPPQYQPQQPPPQMSHLASNNSLRALLTQMQQQQQQLQQQQHQQLQQQARMPYPRTTEEISQKVSDFLRLLQAKSDNGVMRPPQVPSPGGVAAAGAVIPPPHLPPPPVPQQPPPGAASSPGVMETLLSLHQHQQMAAHAMTGSMPAASPASIPSNPSPVHNFLRQMQSESVWNGGNWNQWSLASTKGIKTEQEVLEEQLRAEDERKSEESREQAEKFITATKSKKSDKTKLKEQQQQQQMVEKTMRGMREAEEMRRQEEEEIRRKQEASRRAEVERQRKGEEKRKKEEEKRKKEEEKKERDRLKEEERKKREADEAKKKAADLMAKVQRSQWCPPAASDTSILDIQRSEREQQMLRGLQQQMDAEQQQKIGNKLQLNWNRQMVQHDVSLAEIQAEERQYMKEKQEREKEKAAQHQQQQQQQQQTSQVGTMSGWWQNNPWSSTPAWSSSVNPITSNSTNQSSSSSNNFTSGFWEQLTSSSPLNKNQNGAVNNNSGGGKSSTPTTAPVGNAAPKQPPPQQFSQQAPPQNSQQPSSKESKNKTKRDEMAVLKLFTPSTNDEFSQWCTEALTKIQSSVDIPTFIGFLRELESAQDVQDYALLYLGESKEASDFVRQFLERRRHASGGSSAPHTSSSSGAAGSSPPSNSSQDFQQVKAKNKKKKGRMQKVDSRILNFSTTSASGRINVGDRQYPEE